MRTQAGAIGFEKIETMMGCLLRVTQSSQHVHEGGEERCRQKVTAQPDKVEQTELSLGGPVMNSSEAPSSPRGLHRGPELERETKVTVIRGVQVTNLHELMVANSHAHHQARYTIGC